MTETNKAAREALRGAGERMLDLICTARRPTEVARWLALPLEEAVARGDGELLRKLLQAGAMIPEGALHKAVEAGRTSLVGLLLEYGASVAEEVDYDGTPLTVAAKGDHVDIARLLLHKGADVDYVDGYDQTPLFLALTEGSLAMVELLLNEGADCDLRTTEFGLSPLDCARSADAVRLLIKHGAAVTDACQSGHTALHSAAYGFNVELIQALVEAGAGLEAGDMLGQRPLHYAAGGSYTRKISPDAAFALLKLGAEVNAQTDDGETALHLVADRAGTQGSVKMVELLLRWGADETIACSRGKTARDLANTCRIFNEVPGDDKRVLALLARAPADRAWRRRGLLVLYGAYPDRVRLVGDLARLAAKVFGLKEVGVFRTIVLFL
eukprot:g5833.t1